MTTINFSASDVNKPLIGQSAAEFLARAAPNQKPVKHYQAQIDLMRSRAENYQYEPPPAYWSALWDKPHLKPKQSTAIVQVQGSVVRVKSRRPGGQRGATFERNWNQPPDMWSEDFLKDGYDKFNPHDNAVFGGKLRRGNKNPIHEFSGSSRRLLLDRLMSLEPAAWEGAKFLTLTYHNEWPTPKRAKDNLRAFYKRLVRYGLKRGYKPAMFWRMEIKPRQSGDRIGDLAPHFHLFLFDCPFIPYPIAIKWWQEITGDKTILFLNMTRLDNRRKGMNYVAKYVAKPSEADLALGASPNLDIDLYLAAMGRFWGLEGGDDIPYASISEMALPVLDASLSKFITACELRYEFLRKRRSMGFRVFMFDDAGLMISSIVEDCFGDIPSVPPKRKVVFTDEQSLSEGRKRVLNLWAD